MAENSAIEWTDATVNFWWGCTKVGPGCDHCYAEAWTKRTGDQVFGLGVPRRKIKGAVSLIYRLHASGARPRVFVQSMSDLFDKEVPAEWFDEAWAAIGACSSLDIQIVTKRVSFVEKRLAGRAWPQHAGLIISVVNQDEADRDIPRLVALKKALGIPWIGLSCEPLLGAIVLRPKWLEALDWTIVGGESGPNARAADGDWYRALRDQCLTAGVAFLFKQHGEWIDVRDLRRLPGGDGPGFGAYDHRPYDPDHEAVRVGKRAAGRLLDGVEHNGFPNTQRLEQAA